MQKAIIPEEKTCQRLKTLNKSAGILRTGVSKEKILIFIRRKYVTKCI